MCSIFDGIDWMPTSIITSAAVAECRENNIIIKSCWVEIVISLQRKQNTNVVCNMAKALNNYLMVYLNMSKLIHNFVILLLYKIDFVNVKINCCNVIIG